MKLTIRRIKSAQRSYAAVMRYLQAHSTEEDGIWSQAKSMEQFMDSFDDVTLKITAMNERVR